MRRPLYLLAASPALLVALAGCGAKTLTSDTLEKGAEDAVEKQFGTRPDISCPDDLDAEVGAKTRCTLTAEGLDGTYGVTVTVTSVEGDTANFNVLVDDHPQG